MRLRQDRRFAARNQVSDRAKSGVEHAAGDGSLFLGEFLIQFGKHNLEEFFSAAARQKIIGAGSCHG